MHIMDMLVCTHIQTLMCVFMWHVFVCMYSMLSICSRYLVHIFHHEDKSMFNIVTYVRAMDLTGPFFKTQFLDKMLFHHN